MKKTIFKETYPIWTLELNKNEIKQTNVPEIIEYFKEKIESHPIAKILSIFEQYDHVKSVNGDINPEIINMQNIIFCFGSKIPNSKVAALRPRSIAICELKDKYVIEFLEAPNEQNNVLMEEWAKSLKVN